jgi:membrane protein YdbS with pleckstrin-like domain
MSLENEHQRLSKKMMTSNIKKVIVMLWTLFVILLVLWAMGLLTGYTLGGIIHVLLVVAIIVILFQVIQGRRRV